MTTYKSYEEAKIANTDSVIYEFEGCFSVFKTVGSKECNPADYCMTFNQCEEFKAGMIVLERGSVKTLSVVDASLLNTCKFDSIEREYLAKSYILRASALEKPKRVKVEWEAHDFIRLSDAALAVEELDMYADKSAQQKLTPETLAVHYVETGELKLHSRIETPIEWWEDALQFVKDNAENKITVCESEIYHGGELFIKASMNRDKWCDFARILLEQSED